MEVLFKSQQIIENGMVFKVGWKLTTMLLKFFPSSMCYVVETLSTALHSNWRILKPVQLQLITRNYSAKQEKRCQERQIEREIKWCSSDWTFECLCHNVRDSIQQIYKKHIFSVSFRKFWDVKISYNDWIYFNVQLLHRILDQQILWVTVSQTGNRGDSPHFK